MLLLVCRHVSTLRRRRLARHRRARVCGLRAYADDAWSVEVLAPQLELTVHTGPTPADALRRLVRDLGHQPSPRPAFYGPWVQPFTFFASDRATQLAQVDQLRKADAPFSAVEVTHRYLPCGQYRGQRASIRAANDAFHARGLEAYGYDNPLVCSKYGQSYDKAVVTGGFQRRPDGEPYIFTSYVGAATPPVETVGQLDLGSPAGDAVLFDNLDLTTDDGHDGWMEDFGEYTQLDAVSADGTTGPQLHNRYPRDLPLRRPALRRSSRPGVRPVRALGVDRLGGLLADRVVGRPDRRRAGLAGPVRTRTRARVRARPVDTAAVEPRGYTARPPPPRIRPPVTRQGLRGGMGEETGTP